MEFPSDTFPEQRFAIQLNNNMWDKRGKRKIFMKMLKSMNSNISIIHLFNIRGSKVTKGQVSKNVLHGYRFSYFSPLSKGSLTKIVPSPDDIPLSWGRDTHFEDLVLKSLTLYFLIINRRIFLSVGANYKAVRKNCEWKH